MIQMLNRRVVNDLTIVSASCRDADNCVEQLFKHGMPDYRSLHDRGANGRIAGVMYELCRVATA